MLKKLNVMNMVSAVIMIFLGIMMIAYPYASATAMVYILGFGALIFGISEVISYFMGDALEQMIRNDLVVGLVSIIFGILLLYRTDIIINILPFILGLVIMTNGFLRLQEGSVAHKVGYPHAVSYIILAVISIILGLVIMFGLSGAATAVILFTVIGVSLIFCGFSDLFSSIYLSRKLKKYVDDYKSAHQE